ncbi:MerR family transcriptional regulator [Alkalihalobacterium sp. APHAB7]|uniref:MerR family transcriptional regulator n=1 Tax=Alkalihalobacterium sp. APHAB7 TaxID=3402081 RepID=UPI003AABEAEC
MRVKEVADLVGISVRTLHHYDAIGLLSPEETSDTGYRLYSQQNLDILQQILFFKELDFPLKEIKEILHSPAFNQKEALELQRNMLLEKRRRLDRMIETLDQTIAYTRGEVEMTNQDKFAGFDFTENPFEQEARERWGNEKVNEANAKVKKLSKDEQKGLTEQSAVIYKKLADLKDGSPSSEEAQLAIKEWFDFLNDNFTSYSLDAFKGLGQLYMQDERFTQTIDQYGSGLAQFMCDAMAIYADNNRK